MAKWKCTDCSNMFDIDQGTYDHEWGFHCIYCGGLDVYGVISSTDIKFGAIMLREGLM